MTTPSQTPTLPRRRNGKQQSCEPCRKAKIACDHALPVCGRCKRRKMGARCIYLAAPMTKQCLVEPGKRSEVVGQESQDGIESSGGRQSGMGVRRGEIVGGGIVGGLSTPITGSSATSPESERVRDSQGSSLSRGSGDGSQGVEERQRKRPSQIPTPDSGPFIKSGGFFGPTNFSAVFLENRENLGHNSDIQISNDADAFATFGSSASLQAETFLMLASSEARGSPRVNLGAKVLLALPDQATFRVLLERYANKCCECHFPPPLIIDLANSLWTTFGKELAEPRSLEKLEGVSAVLCKNAERALEEFEDYDPWLAACSGRNMRWEILGGIFCSLSTTILSLPDRDPFFAGQKGDRMVRRNFAVELKDCVQACITLSNYMDLINVSMVQLLIRNLILTTVLSGDASLVTWRTLGDLMATTTALGLHRQTDMGDKSTTFLTEMKRRTFATVFNFDKCTSLLTGRPPFLDKKYCRYKLPLDLDDEALLRGGETLQKAVDALDSNGWNTKGRYLTATSIRTRGILTPVLSEVLELSLGNGENVTGERIQYLMDKIVSVYESFPTFTRFKLSDFSNPTVSDYNCWKRLCLRLITLEHRLLLERLAYKQAFLDGQSMVDCAREMLELTVLIWVQRDRFVEHHHDYDWMLMCWGIPSSGVLCVELLKQIKQGSQLKLPRSEIVQNLSLLIGFLEWVKPAAGNYQLCGRMRIIIKRILDQILNPSPPSSAPTSTQGSTATTTGGVQSYEAGNGIVSHDPSLFEPGTWDGDMDNLDWLNNMDWSRGPCFDLGQDFSTARWN